MNQISDKLAGNEYYHGTMGYKALQILYEGFRFKKDFSDYGSYGTLRHGLYLTKSLSVAGRFGSGYVFKCCLKKGISILWLNEKYDQKVIQYLKREFSKNILTGPISKAIPMNKNLTKNELIHLLNYRFNKTNWQKSKEVQKWRANISSFRQQLVLHKYDGVGETEDMVGVMIFNPSYVKPVKLFNVISRGGEHVLKTYNPRKLSTDIDRFYEGIIEDFDSKEIAKMNYVRSLQERFKKENGLI